ncbi:Rdx family protein [Dehalococcoidia bacterium]|nr:Rdx family protein [Dehalococcoidia bacterium]
MATELFAEGGNNVAIKITPGVGGILQVFVDGDKVYDKKEEDNQTPNLNRVKEIRTVIRERLEAMVPADE